MFTVAIMGSFVYPEPKSTVWHKSGTLDADGLSEEWLTVEFKYPPKTIILTVTI
jgi:hypothetical protein